MSPAEAARAVRDARLDLYRLRAVLEQVEAVSAGGDPEVRDALDRCAADLRALVVTADLAEGVAVERLRRVADGGVA